MAFYTTDRRYSSFGGSRRYGFIMAMAIAFAGLSSMQCTQTIDNHSTKGRILPCVSGFSDYDDMVRCHRCWPPNQFPILDFSTSKETLPSVCRNIHGASRSNKTRPSIYQNTTTVLARLLPRPHRYPDIIAIHPSPARYYLFRPNGPIYN